MSDRRPDPPTFILDHCLSRVTYEVLRAGSPEGVEVLRHTDRFAHDCPDVEWLPVVGHNGWVLLTRDSRIRFRKHELDALRDYSVRAFILRGSNLNGAAEAEVFRLAMPAILHRLERYAAPLIATVSRDAEVKVVDGRRRGGVRR